MRTGAGGPVRLPPHYAGMRIGLYGGSFDPPHAGHRHVALTALRRMRLDRIWWIVTPGNPLKDRRGLAAFADRLAATRAVACHPRMEVTDIDGAIGSIYTVDTLRFLVRRCPDIRFVWIMGADSLAGLHRWRAWREIARLVPIAVIDRPPWTVRAARSPAATALAPSRIDEARAAGLAGRHAPAWSFLHGPRSDLSSTSLRDKSRRNGGPR